jgi:hypothetical protein
MSSLPSYLLKGSRHAKGQYVEGEFEQFMLLGSFRAF